MMFDDDTGSIVSLDFLPDCGDLECEAPQEQSTASPIDWEDGADDSLFEELGIGSPGDFDEFAEGCAPEHFEFLDTADDGDETGSCLSIDVDEFASDGFFSFDEFPPSPPPESPRGTKRAAASGDRSAKRFRYRRVLADVDPADPCAGMSCLAGRDHDGYTYAQWKHSPAEAVSDEEQRVEIAKWLRDFSDSKGVEMVCTVAEGAPNDWCSTTEFMTKHQLYTNLERAEEVRKRNREAGCVVEKAVKTTNLYNNMLAFAHPREPVIRPSRPQAIDWRIGPPEAGKKRVYREVRVNPVHVAVYKELHGLDAV